MNLSDATIIIKTFERPKCIQRLVSSIRNFYPEIHIIIADDSKNPSPIEGTEYHVLPFDCGLSYGRNFLVEKVPTKYLLLLDDDLIFINQTKIEKFVDILDSDDRIDIVGGRRREKHRYYPAELTLDHNGILSIKREKSKGKIGKYRIYDFVQNFFLAKTESIK